MEIKNKLPNIYRKQKKAVSGYILRVTKYANMHEVAIFQPWSRFMKRNNIILITILFNTPRVTYTQVGEFSVIIAKCSTEYIFYKHTMHRDFAAYLNTIFIKTQLFST